MKRKKGESTNYPLNTIEFGILTKCRYKCLKHPQYQVNEKFLTWDNPTGAVHYFL